MPERYDINGNPIGFFSVEDEGIRYVDPTIIQPAVVSANRGYWEAQKWARENVRDPRERTAPYVAAGLGATMAAPFALDVMASGPALAKGLEWVGEKAMPSSLLKGISYYAPKTAGAMASISPWVDAGALSYWSAQGLRNAGRRWQSDNGIDRAAAVAEGAVSALPFAAPMMGAIKEVPRMGREFGKWYDFVVRGDTSPYYKLSIKQKMLNKQADDIIGDWNINDYAVRLATGNVAEGHLPYHTRSKTMPVRQSVRKPQSSAVSFKTPEGNTQLSMNLEDVGIAGETQRDITYTVLGEDPAILAGHPEMVDPYDVGSLDLKIGDFPKRNIAYSDDAFRFDGHERSFQHIPYPWTIDASKPIESLPAAEKSFLDASNKLGWTRGTEVAKGRNTNLLIQGPSQKDFSQIKTHFDGLRQVMGRDGVLSGSGTMYERGILSGVPADTEIITTESRLPALEQKLKFTRTGSNAFDVRGKSDLAHGNKDVDIQVIQGNSHGSATGDLAWSLFRTMYPEEFQRQAQRSIKYNMHYTDMGIYDPNAGVLGTPYSPEKLLDDFNSGNWSLQNTINDALMIMKDVKHRNGGSQDQLLKHNRPIALLTNKDPEIQSMVGKAIDTIGKSQVGWKYRNGSDYFPNIDFTDVVANRKFLSELGLNEKFADDPKVMKNLFDYWYMQNSIQKRGVRGAQDVNEALKFTMTGNNQRGGGDASGAGRNTVSSTRTMMPFSYEQVGAMQTHMGGSATARNVNDVLQRYNSFGFDSPIDSNISIYAGTVWNNNNSTILQGMDPNEAAKINAQMNDFFLDEPKTVEDLSDKIAILSNKLKRDGVSAESVDQLIDGLSDIYDIPFFRATGYGGEYRGVLKAKSDAGGVRYFDFNKTANPEIRPYEFGRPVEKYAEDSSFGASRTLRPEEYENEIEDVMAESKELAKRLQMSFIDGPEFDHRPTFGELKQQYGATARDYRKEIQDIAQKALDNRNEREVISAKIDELERMPGAKARLRREEQLVKDAFFGEFSDSALREMKVDKIGKKELKNILQNLTPSADWHGPSDELKNISADEIVHVRRNGKDRFIITRRTPALNDKGFQEKDYDIVKRPHGWVFEDPYLPFANGGLMSRLQKHYGSNEKALEALRNYKINSFARGGRKYDRNSKTDDGDLYYDIVRQRRNSVFNALMRAGMSPNDAARLAPMIVTQQTMEGGWVLNRKDNNYGGMKSAGKTIAFDSEDDFQDAYIKMLDSKWHNGRAVENSWRSARNLDDWARILNREDLGLSTKEAWEKYNRGKRGNDFVYLYAPQWENNNKPYREHLKKTEDRTAAYLKMVEADEPLMSLSPRMEEQAVRQIPSVSQQPALPLGMFRTMIPTSVQQKMPATRDAQQQAPTQAPLLRSFIPTSVQNLMNSRQDGGFLKDYRSGGKIHIKPENRGKFTALKKRTGHSASWFKAHGTPAQKKMATFALNARKWKHGDGGLIERYGIDKVRAVMQKVKR